MAGKKRPENGAYKSNLNTGTTTTTTIKEADNWHVEAPFCLFFGAASAFMASTLNYCSEALKIQTENQIYFFLVYMTLLLFLKNKTK